MSGSWKNLEKATALALGGTRVLRGADFSKSDVDVIVPDFETLRVDCKYRIRWAHHQFLTEIMEKYGRGPEDIPVLVTKQHKQQGATVVLSLEHFGILLEVIRGLRSELEEERKSCLSTPSSVPPVPIPSKSKSSKPLTRTRRRARPAAK